MYYTLLLVRSFFDLNINIETGMNEGLVDEIVSLLNAPKSLKINLSDKLYNIIFSIL